MKYFNFHPVLCLEVDVQNGRKCVKWKWTGYIEHGWSIWFISCSILQNNNYANSFPDNCWIQTYHAMYVKSEPNVLWIFKVILHSPFLTITKLWTLISNSFEVPPSWRRYTATHDGLVETLTCECSVAIQLFGPEKKTCWFKVPAVQ